MMIFNPDLLTEALALNEKITELQGKRDAAIKWAADYRDNATRYVARSQKWFSYCISDKDEVQMREHLQRGQDCINDAMESRNDALMCEKDARVCENEIDKLTANVLYMDMADLPNILS